MPICCGFVFSWKGAGAGGEKSAKVEELNIALWLINYSLIILTPSEMTQPHTLKLCQLNCIFIFVAFNQQ